MWKSTWRSPIEYDDSTKSVAHQIFCTKSSLKTVARQINLVVNPTVSFMGQIRPTRVRSNTEWATLLRWLRAPVPVVVAVPPNRSSKFQFQILFCRFRPDSATVEGGPWSRHLQWGPRGPLLGVHGGVGLLVEESKDRETLRNVPLTVVSVKWKKNTKNRERERE